MHTHANTSFFDYLNIFNYSNWEPGYTQVKVLRVANEGSLALKWYAKLVSTNGVSDLANVIDVYVKEDVTAYPTDRNDLTGWTCVGTLVSFINSIESTTTGTLEAYTSESLGIAFKMQESAGDEDMCYAINTGEGDGTHSLVVSNSTIKGWSSYGTAIKDLTFTNCTVNGVMLTAENWTSLIVSEDDCGEGQINIEGKNVSYMTASNIFDYVIFE